MCGTFNGECYDDLKTPNNCIARNAEIFLESFDTSKQNISNLGRFDCIFEKQMLLDTISRRDMGHHTKHQTTTNNCQENNTITEENAICMKEKYIVHQEIPALNCYSTKKIPYCITGCQPVKFVHKMISFWCTKRNEDTDYINSLIRNENVRFVSDTVTKKINMTVTFACLRNDNIVQERQNIK